MCWLCLWPRKEKHRTHPRSSVSFIFYWPLPFWTFEHCWSSLEPFINPSGICPKKLTLMCPMSFANKSNKSAQSFYLGPIWVCWFICMRRLMILTLMWSLGDRLESKQNWTNWLQWKKYSTPCICWNNWNTHFDWGGHCIVYSLSSLQHPCYHSQESPCKALGCRDLCQ